MLHPRTKAGYRRARALSPISRFSLDEEHLQSSFNIIDYHASSLCSELDRELRVCRDLDSYLAKRIGVFASSASPREGGGDDDDDDGRESERESVSESLKDNLIEREGESESVKENEVKNENEKNDSRKSTSDGSDSPLRLPKSSLATSVSAAAAADDPLRPPDLDVDISLSQDSIDERVEILSSEIDVEVRLFQELDAILEEKILSLEEQDEDEDENEDGEEEEEEEELREFESIWEELQELIQEAHDDYDAARCGSGSESAYGDADGSSDSQPMTMTKTVVIDLPLKNGGKTERLYPPGRLPRLKGSGKRVMPMTSMTMSEADQVSGCESADKGRDPPLPTVRTKLTKSKTKLKTKPMKPTLETKPLPVKPLTMNISTVTHCLKTEEGVEVELCLLSGEGGACSDDVLTTTTATVVAGGEVKKEQVPAPAKVKVEAKAQVKAEGRKTIWCGVVPPSSCSGWRT